MSTVAANLAKKMASSRSTIVFTGAGMSTESGLPDFRSSKGLWGQYSPEELASTEALNRNFENFAAFYGERVKALGGIEPNRGHRILADWERRGLVQAIVTQNVDGLHQAVGSRAVYELHGTLREVRCQSCSSVFPAEGYESRARCGSCGGKLRPAVVLFGEMLPERTLSESIDLASTCELFIVLGSSLLVSPANMLPERAKRNGGALYIVNNTETPLDGMADGVIHTSIGEVLAEVDGLLAEEGHPATGTPKG
ncbi:MAG TPA: NAD-dependent protein deacylase [Synergistaceae bacterium]|jgi:NAD-dependent deacetylase|nr:NAD-dependent protein deacylase [Synergistaceae bacterium]